MAPEMPSTRTPVPPAPELPRRYRRPVLRTFGTLRELTLQQGPGPFSDAGNNRMGFSL
jgi:hypothetical protein